MAFSYPDCVRTERWERREERARPTDVECDTSEAAQGSEARYPSQAKDTSAMIPVGEIQRVDLQLLGEKLVPGPSHHVDIRSKVKITRS